MSDDKKKALEKLAREAGLADLEGKSEEEILAALEKLGTSRASAAEAFEEQDAIFAAALAKAEGGDETAKARAFEALYFEGQLAELETKSEDEILQALETVGVSRDSVKESFAAQDKAFADALQKAPSKVRSIQTGPRWATAFVMAGGSFAMAASLILVLGKLHKLPESAYPTPTPTATATASGEDAGVAPFCIERPAQSMLNDAFRACSSHRWEECLQNLDQVKRMDPVLAESDYDAVTARANAERELAKEHKEKKP